MIRPHHFDRHMSRLFKVAFGDWVAPEGVFKFPEFNWLLATISDEARLELNARLAEIPKMIAAHEADIVAPYEIERNLLDTRVRNTTIRQRLKDIEVCEENAKKTSAAVRPSLRRHYELKIWLEIWTKDQQC